MPVNCRVKSSIASAGAASTIIGAQARRMAHSRPANRVARQYGGDRDRKREFRERGMAGSAATFRIMACAIKENAALTRTMWDTDIDVSARRREAA